MKKVVTFVAAAMVALIGAQVEAQCVGCAQGVTPSFGTQVYSAPAMNYTVQPVSYNAPMSYQSAGCGCAQPVATSGCCQSAPVADPCCSSRPRLLGRFRARRASRGCCDPCATTSCCGGNTMMAQPMMAEPMMAEPMTEGSDVATPPTPSPEADGT